MPRRSVGLTLLYLGLTLTFNRWGGVVLGVILREERCPEQIFGTQSRPYRWKVRRYV
jgi:hypothetical protein